MSKAQDQLHKAAMEQVWKEMVVLARSTLNSWRISGAKHPSDEWGMERLDLQTILYIDQNLKKPARDREVPDDAANVEDS